MKLSSFSKNFRKAEPFNLDYVIPIWIIGPNSPVFTIKILGAVYMK